MRMIIRSLVALVLGIGLATGGAVKLAGNDASCGSSTLSDGDVCVETTTHRIGGDTTETRTLDEQRQHNHNEGLGLLIGGIVLALGSGVMLFISVRRRSHRPSDHMAGHPRT